MKTLVNYFLTAILLLSISCKVTNLSPVKVYDQTVEGRRSLLGSDILNPRFSWKLQGSKNDLMQQSYRILVASSKENLNKEVGDMWDSNTVSSDSSVNIVYGGKPLQSYQQYFWKVQVTTNQGDALWSEIDQWTMGILDSSEWKAKWIGLDGFNERDKPENTFTRLSARNLRKEFNVPKKIESATAFISGMGLYELQLNGKKVGEDVLTPTVSEYNKTIYYNTYDVSDFIKSGTNCVGVILGNGRYFGMRKYHGKPDPLTQIPQIHYGLPRLLFQLRIQYTDGSTATIVSDEQWKVTDQGPIIANNEFDGEEYDATRELTGWSTVGYNDAGWKQVDMMPPVAKNLVAQPNENIRIKEILKPVKITPTNRGTFILDMGQNMVGWISFKAKGNKGDTLKMRFSETLKGKDSLYLDNMRNAQVTDKYIFKGEGIEKWEPRFTYHGFRYVEVSGLKNVSQASDFEGKVVYDDIETIGTFETSDSTINQVFKNSYWTSRGNYRGMPTDCPQRDERVGWLGDRVISSYGESFLFDNSRLYAKWLDDINDAQLESGSLPDIAPTYWERYMDNVTYPSAFILIPEMLRRQFGDFRSLQKHYPAMKKWMMYMWNTYNENDLVLKDNYGDWCVPPESLDLIWAKDSSRITEGGLLASAYYYYCLNLMKHYADLLNNTADAQEFDNIARRVHKAFNARFYNPVEKTYSNNTVTANLLPLSFGLAPENDRDAIFSNIRGRLKEFDNHVNSGIIGGMWLMRGLTDNGAIDLAYKLASNRTYPSWGYMVEKGATTIWELWNGDAANPMMNSGNHQMLLGDLLIWYYEDLAGIKSDGKDVAFKKIIMNPVYPEGLDFTEASLQTKYGMVKSSWRKNDEGLEWTVTIPPNSSAEVYFPTTDNKKIKQEGIQMNQQLQVGKHSRTKENGMLMIGSGTYTFKVTK